MQLAEICLFSKRGALGRKKSQGEESLGKSVLLEQQQSCGGTIHQPRHCLPISFISPSQFSPPQCQHLLLAWMTTSTPPPERQHQGLTGLKCVFPYGLRSETSGWGVFLIPPLWPPCLVAEVATGTLKVSRETTWQHRRQFLKLLPTFTNDLCPCPRLRACTNVFA